VSEYRQPWNSVSVGRRRVRLQILDPQTAFEFEPRLIEALGDTLALTAAAPDKLTTAVWRHAAQTSEDLEQTLLDPVHGPAMARQAMLTFAELVAEALTAANISPRLAALAFRRLLFGKLEIDGRRVATPREYVEAGLRPLDKWRLLGAQIQQSYGPLWLRSPYRLRSHREDYGVPRPKDVPVAVAWADSLAVRGSASSSIEILTTWTPVQMIQVVEVAAQQAEIERRAAEHARKGGR
jgi:hypothetical protein